MAVAKNIFVLMSEKSRLLGGCISWIKEILASIVMIMKHQKMKMPFQER